MKDSTKIMLISWIVWLLIIGVCVALSLYASGCIQHELTYEYYLAEPNSVHVETLHYKQNVVAARTDKWLVDAAFADVIKVKMDRSVQVPDPNTAKAVTEGVIGTVIGLQP